METTYNYNPRGFLRSAVENYDEASVTRSYTYDLFGNQDYSYSMNTDNYDYYHSYYDYDKNNRLIEEEYASDIKNDENVVVSTDIRTIYTYDANGNQLTSASTYTAGTQNGTTFKTTANTYNLLGQLSGVSVTENGTTSSMQYLYDSDGLLKRKTADSYENFYWDNGQLSVQMSGVGSQYRMYFRGMMLHGARTRTEMYHYRQNAHGDVIWMSTGIDTKTYFYDPFGQQVSENGMPVTDTDDENPLRYCGEFLDAHSGNYYLRNRYYNPGTGRFISEDPIRDGLNWYVYCGNNPVMFTDPMGLWMLGDENSPQWAQDAIAVYTVMWESAESDAERNIAHQKAEEVRLFVSTYYNSRNDWGAAEPVRPLDSIVGTRADYYNKLTYHHTNRPSFESMDTLQRAEQRKKFYDVPYHFVIDENGTVYEGRSLQYMGAHVDGDNEGNIGIALMGNFEENASWWQKFKDKIQGAEFRNPTRIQVENTKQLVGFLDDAYGLPTIGGHNNFAEGYTTDCPGSRLIEILSPTYKNVYTFSSGRSE